MAASRTRTVRLSHDLHDALEALLGEMPEYKTPTALIKWTLRYTAATHSSHKVTRKWASVMSPAQEDKLDAALLRRIKAGEGMTAQEAAEADWTKL